MLIQIPTGFPFQSATEAFFLSLSGQTIIRPSVLQMTKAGWGLGMRLPNSYISQTGLTPSYTFLLPWEQQNLVSIGHHVDRLHL